MDSPAALEDGVDSGYRPPRWSLGMLNDKETDEVPGSVLLMSKAQAAHNEPLGLRMVPARVSASSLPSPFAPQSRADPGSDHVGSGPPTTRPPTSVEKKKTANGKIILEPQPDDSPNDPLNWPAWRRDIALFCLGFYCMLGGGMTPVLAAGFNDVAQTYGVTVPQVALTTGLYMLGLGIGSVVFSPTAILFGKRPVYLVGALLFLLSSVWCALSPNYASLVVARVFQGLAVSPVECLPSATIAEIFFLHERAYRLGIYTLLLLGGKNLVPLVSAAIIQSLGWRWVFWVVAIIVGGAGVLLFFFVPETFWDRTPRAHEHKHRRKGTLSSIGAMFGPGLHRRDADASGPPQTDGTIAQRRLESNGMHPRFAGDDKEEMEQPTTHPVYLQLPEGSPVGRALAHHSESYKAEPAAGGPPTPFLHTLNSPFYTKESSQGDYLDARAAEHPAAEISDAAAPGIAGTLPYTHKLQFAPPQTFRQTLKPWNGRLRKDSWFKCALRPFVLFAYPSILWSTLVYSLSVGWLIVLSESVSSIYRDGASYNFSALQTGLVYLSPFVGGVLGTAVAGRVSDVVVRFLSRRNDGVYEPEFRLVMALPVLLTTVAGLVGFGWSAQERDRWIVPTVFFGVISFGCSLGSTTAITFAVDSYRQYAGEALVTLNFSKNVLHGLVFSLFFPAWLEADGPKSVFLAIGGVQVVCLLTTVPMYVFGKRARMWTVRRNMMERI